MVHFAHLKHGFVHQNRGKHRLQGNVQVYNVDPCQTYQHWQQCCVGMLWCLNGKCKLLQYMVLPRTSSTLISQSSSHPERMVWQRVMIHMPVHTRACSSLPTPAKASCGVIKQPCEKQEGQSKNQAYSENNALASNMSIAESVKAHHSISP